MSNFQVISDHSKEKLYDVPEKILTLSGLKMLFLEGNFIRELPEDFFDKLTHLTWLDLRNNRLAAFPATVAHHGYLECLFLTNNQLERLPNELGLVPNLKSLQVANNPLIYPKKDVLGRGTKGVKDFLMRQHYLKSDDAPQEEVLLKIVDEEPSKVEKKKSKSSTNVKTSIEDAFSFTQITEPELTVTRLSKPHKATQNSLKTEEKDHIVHKIRTSASKMSVLSYYDKMDTKKFEKIVNQKKLRDEWLDKLRVLLANQEKIIQQEKNLSTLSIWRHEAQSNRSRETANETTLSVPFATDEKYSKIPTRQELQEQLNTYLTEKTSITCIVPKNNNLDSLIGDVVKQIRHLEEKYEDNLSPRAEIEEAEKRIRMFLDIHKKLQWLKATNNANLS